MAAPAAIERGPFSYDSYTLTSTTANDDPADRKFDLTTGTQFDPDINETIDYTTIAEMATQLAITKKYNLIVIEDAAQSMGSYYKKKHAGTFGKISAISLNTGKIVWQIPAGTFQLKNSEVVIGSRSAGGIADGGANDNISFFTGSLDKKIYAIRNKDGKYLWDDELPASDSAPPLVYNTSSERWIFVVTSVMGKPNDSSKNIVAFKQKLN